MSSAFARALALLVALLALAPLLTSGGAVEAASGPDQTPGQQITLRAKYRDSWTRVGVREKAIRSGSVAAAQAAGATITINFIGGWDANAQASFQYAADVWEGFIVSSVTITIDATWQPLGPGILGSAGPNSFFANFSGGPLPNTWYPVGLANAIAGTDLRPAQADMDINISSSFGWYLGTDGNTPGGQYDLVSVVMHEIGHGLGFTGSMTKSGSSGSWGYGTSFPFIYDRFSEDSAGNSLIVNPPYPNPSTALGNALTSGNVFFDGPAATAAAGGRPELYAPGGWSGGSSFSHLDESSYPAGTPNSLMTPQIGSAEAIHDPGPVTLGIFDDIGWELLGAPEPTALDFQQQPDAGTAGTAFATQPRVAVTDGSGGVIATDNSTVVTLALSGGPGPLTCDSGLSRTVAAGVATFTGCTIDQAGTGYSITASSSPALTPDTTANFDVAAIDTTPPIDPIPASTSHTPGVPSANDTIDVAWPPVDQPNGASDAESGVAGYSWSVSANAIALPDQIQDNAANELTASSGPLADGTYYVNLRTVDNAGNWTSTEHIGPFVIDTTPPTNPTTASTSHIPWSGVSSAVTTVVLTWPLPGQSGGATDPSGVSGYSWSFSENAPASPDQAQDGDGTTTGTDSGVLTDGSWYFNISSVDAAGNWSTGTSIGPFVIRRSTTLYFAEGFTGSGWETEIQIVNANTVPANVEVTYFQESGQPVIVNIIIPGERSRTLDANNPAEGPGSGAAFGVVITSDVAVTAKQTLTDTVGGLSHGTAASPTLSTTWLFAEGFTGNGWLTFVSATNPNATPAQVTIEYHKADGTSVTEAATIAPQSRHTFSGHEDVPNSAFSVSLTSDIPIVAQEVLIDTVGLLAHGTVGVQTATTQWHLAEGFTGDGWLTFISVGNFGGSEATVWATYNILGSAPVVKQITVPAGSRGTFVAHELESGVGPGQSFGVTVTSNVPVVVQEVLIDPKPGVALAHAVMASPSLGTTFSFGGGTSEADWLTFLSATNPRASPVTVTATYYFESDTPPLSRNVTVPANSRATFASSDPETGVPAGERFGIVITATDPIISQETIIFLGNFSAGGLSGTLN